MPANYWDDRWLNDDTSWDMRRVSPPLQAYLAQLTDKTVSILIPGCGNAYEAGWLLDNGFPSVTLIDISPTLTARLREKFPTIPIITGDFFEHTGQYDLIIEQTFFCSLDPSLREKYVEHTHSLLRPGGKLTGLLFDRNFVGASSLVTFIEASSLASSRSFPSIPREPRSFPSLRSGIVGGPPFGGHKDEYQTLLEKKFEVKTLAPCYNSIKPRAGTELFLIAQKP